MDEKWRVFLSIQSESIDLSRRTEENLLFQIVTMLVGSSGFGLFGGNVEISQYYECRYDLPFVLEFQ